MFVLEVIKETAVAKRMQTYYTRLFLILFSTTDDILNILCTYTHTRSFCINMSIHVQHINILIPGYLNYSIDMYILNFMYCDTSKHQNLISNEHKAHILLFPHS